MLTGQRPDSTGGYNFETKNPTALLNIPMMFSRNGYATAGYGKILHNEKNIFGMDWNVEQFNNNWYKVQNTENGLFMNASVTPDKHTPEESFPDHIFTSRAIKTIRTAVHNNSVATTKHRPFMVGLGFKLPHLALHVPFKYFDLYREQATASPVDQVKDSWPYHFQSTADLSFPVGASEIGYSLSNQRTFEFMNREGASKSAEGIRLKNEPMIPFPKRAHLEVTSCVLHF